MTCKTEELFLIEGCLNNKSNYQTKLYNRYQKTMYKLCLKYTKNHDDAKDAMQNGFIKVFTKLHTFKSNGSFEGWIKRIMIHCSLEIVRKNKVMGISKENTKLNTNYLVGECTYDIVQNKELIKIIDELPPGFRKVFKLHAIEGYTHVEIAKQLNVHKATARSQYLRARGKLKKMLK